VDERSGPAFDAKPSTAFSPAGRPTTVVTVYAKCVPGVADVARIVLVF